jgi:hypothetical protein
MIVNHDLDIAEDLTISPVGLISCLSEQVATLTLKHAMGL